VELIGKRGFASLAKSISYSISEISIQAQFVAMLENCIFPNMSEAFSIVQSRMVLKDTVPFLSFLSYPAGLEITDSLSELPT
jgi:hypothetical protein